MEQIQKLPLAAKIAIPAALLLVIGLLVWSTMLRPVETVLAKSSTDAAQIQAAKVVLDRAKVTVEAKTGTSGEFELWVPKTQATQAREALAATGLQGRLDAKSKKDCGTAPGITATSSDRNKHDNCMNEQAIEQSVLGLNGVLSATATVTRQESSDVFGDMTAKVTVQVFLREEARQQFVQNISGLAGMIANMVEGATTQTVMIQDGNGGGMFYDGSSRKSSRGANAAGTAATSGGGSCTSLRDQFTDITAKEQAIKECYEQDLGSKIASYAGGDEHYTILVTPKVNGSSKEIVINTPLRGVPTSTNSNKTSGNGQTSSSSDTSNVTGQKTTTQSIAPGDISSLRISAALDSRTVTPAEEKAVRDMLTDVMASTATKAKPSITRFPFTGADGQPAPQAPPANANGTNADGVGAAAAPAPATMPALVGKPGMSKVLIALMAVLVIGLLTAIAVLWRRSTRMAADRVRYESEFRNEQRLFENFAQQNPDDIARDLEALFGAPAADPRTHV